MPENTDHALVIHVWHLDTLDELSGYVANFTVGADRYVTYPDSFTPDICQTIAKKFPGAFYVPVKNEGQDIGALFQLMDKIDLKKYEFICKIHTKKGPMMPNEWRWALLNGVLGTREQVAHIIKSFRADSNVQLAGTRQLFLHGNANLGPNAPLIEGVFGNLIKDFDFYNKDWGFIAGTCFWIRTAALLSIKDSPLNFEASEGYISDGTMAHAIERIFGMYAALCGGKVLLQNLNFPDRLPDLITGWPDSLEKTSSKRLGQNLTSLIGGNYSKSTRPMSFELSSSEFSLSNRKRVAVFASYSSNGLLPPQVLPYLAGLKSLTKSIIVVFDNDLAPGEREKLSPFANHVISGRHGEYDFGSYKRGIEDARKNGLLEDADDLILCNDSCYGPIRSFAPMVAKMEARELDFWGATDSHEYGYHLQTYWISLSKKVFSSKAFKNFIDGVKKEENVQKVITNYEIGLTKSLVAAGFNTGALIENSLRGIHAKDPSYNNLTLFPIYKLNQGLPLVKVKALSLSRTNADGQNRLLVWLQRNAPDLYETATSNINIKRFEDADAEAFSLIMPTHNRAWCITHAVTSVLAQSHKNFELIIVDDGSTDGTEEIVARDFSEEISSGKIKYIRLPKNIGVCNARNVGLIYARHPWIAYADTDNTLRPYYLTMVANAIVENRDHDAFYGMLININGGSIVGSEFDRQRLLNANFIDLGVFVHRKSLVSRFGGFDPDLKRLVDWDLIIRFTSHKAPKFIPRVFLNYSDDENADRITLKEPLSGVLAAVHTKHSVRPTVSTAIVSYNHQEFLVEALESALCQKGNFTHDIMISDDGSTDGCRRIIDRYIFKYPNKIRDISRGGNFGVSENYKHCFRQAAGNFIAILEGDDYWTDDEKNLKQAEFLNNNSQAAMVFSRVEVFDTLSNKRRLLKRQDALSSLLTGANFAKNEHLNLIANFSSAMFRRDVMRSLPSAVYQPRLNEISLSFYLDRIGKIGFIDKVMGVYRQNSASVWTGASRVAQLQQAVAIRESAVRIADPAYQAKIQERLKEKEKQLVELKLKEKRGVAA